MIRGQIGLVFQPTSFIERLVCNITRSKSYHCVLAITDYVAVSAEPGGAVLRPTDYWPNTVWSQFALSEADVTAITAIGAGFIGTPYNFLDDLMIGIGIAYRYKAPLWIRKWLSSDSSLECAQLCDSAYEHAGLHIFDDGRLPGAVFPGSFEPIWKANGWN